MKKLFICSIIAVLCVPIVGLAQGASDNNRSRAEQQLEQKQQEREARLEARNARQCEKRELRIDSIEERLALTNDQRDAHFARIVDIIENAILRFEDQGVDTTTLVGLVDQLNSSIGQINAAQADLETQLLQLGSSACLDDPAEFSQQLKTARTALRSLREADRQAVRLVREEVIAEFRAFNAAETNTDENAAEESESTDTDSENEGEQ